MKREGYSYEDLRLNKGDAIPAAKWNGIVDALPVGLGKTRDGRRPVSYTEIFFGKPTTAFTAGTTFILDPCDASGADNGAPTLTCFVQQNGGSYTMNNGTSVATSEVVPFTQVTANYYALGTARLYITAMQLNSTSAQLEIKTRDSWGMWGGSESAFTLAVSATTCAA